MQFDCLHFDTSDLMIRKERAGLEIPLHYRHRETGIQFETKTVNFWTLRTAGRSDWPNITLSAASDLSPRASRR